MIRAAAVVLMSPANQVLLLKRSDKHKTQPNQWVFPGGKLDYIGDQIRYEDYHEAAVRELYEETNLVVSMIKETEFILTSKKAVTKIFMAHTYNLVNGLNIVLSGEHVEYKFVGVDDFKKLDVSTSTDSMLYNLFYHV